MYPTQGFSIPMGIVSYKPLFAKFFYNTFASIASGNLYDIFHHENPVFNITLTLINLTVTDYAFITIARDGNNAVRALRALQLVFHNNKNKRIGQLFGILFKNKHWLHDINNAK